MSRLILVTNQSLEQEAFDPTVVVRVRKADVRKTVVAAIELATGQTIFAIGSVESITHMINTERLEPMG